MTLEEHCSIFYPSSCWIHWFKNQLEILSMTSSTWQRMFLSIVGIFTIEGSWRWAIAHLYTLPTYAIAGFVSLTTNCFYVVGSIVIFMVTGRLIYEWRMNTSQMNEVVSEASNVVEDQVERVVKAKYFDDRTI